jgi:prephenate dehydratase
LGDRGIRDGAAIASIRAATVYEAEILRNEIEDNKENYTRFLLLSRDSKPLSRGNKTSIVFSTRNSPGMLFRCLAAFALRDIDLTKLESRPLHGKPWEYFFYVDFLGNPNDENSQNGLRHLKEMTTFLRVLGCYPKASE